MTLIRVVVCPSCCLSVNNWKTVKVADLASFLGLQTLGKNQTGVFSISGSLVKSHINKNCHNFITVNDIDMKLESAMSKTFHGDCLPANYDNISTFLIYGPSRATQRPTFRCMVFNSKILIKINLFSKQKMKAEQKKENRALLLLLQLKVLFSPKKMTSAEFSQSCYYKVNFLIQHMRVCTYVSNIKFLA